MVGAPGERIIVWTKGAFIHGERYAIIDRSGWVLDHARCDGLADAVPLRQGWAPYDFIIETTHRKGY